MASGKTSNSIEGVRADLVRIGAIKRRLTLAKVGEMCGLKATSFYPALTKGRLGEVTRANIEAIFNYDEPIWSTTRELLLRKSCKERAGTDPALLLEPELHQFAIRLGVRFSTGDTRAAVLDAVLQFIAANPIKPL